MSSRLDFLRDGGAIYARSFAMIRAEADLARFQGTAERVVVRMIHACGMTDLPADVEMSEDFAARGGKLRYVLNAASGRRAPDRDARSGGRSDGLPIRRGRGCAARSAARRRS